MYRNSDITIIVNIGSLSIIQFTFNPVPPHIQVKPVLAQLQVEPCFFPFTGKTLCMLTDVHSCSRALAAGSHSFQAYMAPMTTTSAV